MADLQENPVWEEGIYQFEETDVVQGGPQGIDNVPTGQLANRTAYLKQEQDSLKKNFDSEEIPNPLPQYLLQAKFLRAMLGKPVHESIVGRAQDDDLITPSVGQKLYVADYQTAYEIISQADNFIDEATKAADPFQYAGYWGFGNDGDDFFTPPNLPLTMHIKSAGSYGNAGESKEDHLQNITGSMGTQGRFASSGTASFDGALSLSRTGAEQWGGSSGITTQGFDFDASRVARTDTFTDSMGTFFDPYIWLPKGVF